MIPDPHWVFSGWSGTIGVGSVNNILMQAVLGRRKVNSAESNRTNQAEHTKQRWPYQVYEISLSSIDGFLKSTSLNTIIMYSFSRVKSS